MGANTSASQSSRLRPLPTTDKLRPLLPLPQRTVRLSVTPQLRTDDEPTFIRVARTTRQLRAQSGNYDTMRSNAQQAATRPERRDPASCCALA